VGRGELVNMYARATPIAIGTIEGTFRTDADGDADADHVSFATAEPLRQVAGAFRKGTEGVNRLQLASNVETDPEVLAELVVDEDDDARWWAAQNRSTPSKGLIEALHAETHPMVLGALLANPRMPIEEVRSFTEHPLRDVSAVAQRRVHTEDYSASA